MKKRNMIIGISLFLFSMMIGGLVINNNIKISNIERLEPLILRVYGFTRYKENSEILSIVEYYNEVEEKYYYEIEFAYEEYIQDNTELVYIVKSAIFIIEHDFPGDKGDLFFTDVLELIDNFSNIRERVSLTKQIYAPIATYTKEELVKISENVLDKYGYND